MARQQPTGGRDSGRDSPDSKETFRSEIVDLGELNLAELSLIPNSVLRAAVQRVRAELAAGEEATAYFQSSLPDKPTADAVDAAEPMNDDGKYPDGNGMRKADRGALP